jgi:site-specific recombinase XerD
MTDHFFRDFRTAPHLHDGPLGVYVDDFAALLQEQGYSAQCARVQTRLVADLSRWLRRQGLAANDLSPQRLKTYLKYRKHHVRPNRSDASALQKLISLLRERGIVGQERCRAVQGPREFVEKAFEQYLSQERGLTQATVVNYLPFVHQFLLERFGSKRIRLSKLCAADIIDFVQRHAHDFSFGRTKLMVSALRSFLRHLRHRGKISTDLAACVPCVPNWSFASLPKFLLPGQVQQVLDHCDQQTETGKRDYAILLLLARLGLRAGEVVSLTLDDIDWDAGLLTVRSKGGRWTQLPLAADVGEALACYLQNGRPRCSSRRIFIRIRAPRVGFANSIAICSLVESALIRAGVDSPRKGAHLFRHTLATEMLRHGASLAEIGELLRHRHPNTTTIYAKVDLTALRGLALPWPGGER